MHLPEAGTGASRDTRMLGPSASESCLGANASEQFFLSVGLTFVCPQSGASGAWSHSWGSRQHLQLGEELRHGGEPAEQCPLPGPYKHLVLLFRKPACFHWGNT